MAPKAAFLLKDSPAEAISVSDREPHGRSYNAKHSQQPGGIKVEELLLGMKLASMAITDDKPDTLKNTSKVNPWQEQAVTMITNGSREDAHKPLSEILKQYFDLTLDCHIDVSGISRGRALDTQGYIAHNDKIIVLSYRCTTSALDWITNFDTTSSEWEPEVDIELGHAGWCSCLMGRFSSKPRVHTGFYNNFINTAKDLEKHILPLLAEDQPPRKLFVVGHSLGAGIATLAGIYFLLECQWEKLPHKLVCVTAGSPRSCKSSFKAQIENRLKELRPLDKVTFCRIVLNEDVVTKVPPKLLGFDHVGKMVYITQEGEILINPRRANKIDDKDLQKLIASNPYASITDDSKDEFEEEKKDDTGDDVNEDLQKRQEKYQKMVGLVPGPLKDHMPDFYLAPIVNLFEKEHKGESYQK